jgi:hypothetical protein
MTGFSFTPIERTTELFLYCLDRLRVDDDGLAPGNDMGDLNAAAFLCHMVKALAIAPRDVQDILLFELADATESLLMTAVMPADGDVATRWAKARAAVVKNELDGL